MCFVWGRATPARGDNFISELWAQMRERQLVRVQYMSTFHGTNGMSIKRRYTDAFSLVASEMLSGDAALLFQPYSGCTGNILSFYPSTSPRSISDPLAINDFFCSPSLPLSALPPFHVQLFMLESLKFFYPTLLLLQYVFFLSRPPMEIHILILPSIIYKIKDCVKMNRWGGGMILIFNVMCLCLLKAHIKIQQTCNGHWITFSIHTIRCCC